MNEYNQEINQFQSDENTVSNQGLMFKTLLGVIIAFGIAIPNLAHGDLFLDFLHNFNDVVTFLMVLGVPIALGVTWFNAYRMLQKDHGALMNMVIYIVTCVLAGLFFGNALYYAADMISSNAPDLDMEVIVAALQITTTATFIAVVAGVIALPKLKMDGQALKFFRNASVLLTTMTFVGGIMWIIGLLLNIFGMSFLFDMYYQSMYGLGPISFIYSIIAILGAEYLFLTILGKSKYAVGREPKHMEYYYSIILVNAIIRIYVEIFKMVLKIIMRKKEENNND